MSKGLSGMQNFMARYEFMIGAIRFSGWILENIIALPALDLNEELHKAEMASILLSAVLHIV